jgi:hypothetical protein
MSAPGQSQTFPGLSAHVCSISRSGRQCLQALLRSPVGRVRGGGKRRALNRNRTRNGSFLPLYDFQNPPLDKSVNQNYIPASPCHQRDVSRSSRNVARVAMDAVASGGIARRAKSLQRTAKSCGPGAATVASIRGGLCCCDNGDNQRRSPGRARISRKAIAWGKPGCLGPYL